MDLARREDGYLPAPVHAALSAAAIALFSWAAVALSDVSDGVALWWPAAGAAVASVVTARPAERRWIVLLVLLVSAAGNVLGGRPLAVSIMFGVSNAAEAAVAGAWLLRGAAGRPALATLPDLGRLLVATLLGATVIAVGATLTVVVFLGDQPWPTYLHVFASHASAVLVVTPLVLRQPRERTVTSRGEAFAQIATTLIATLVLFGTDWPLLLPFLVVAPLIWGALRLGLRTVTLEVVAVMALALTLTAILGGPFPLSAPAQFAGSVAGGVSMAFAFTQVFIISMFAIVLSTAIVVSQWRSVLGQLAVSERILRGGFDDALLGAAILRVHGTDLEVVEMNDVAADLLGLAPEEMEKWDRAFGDQQVPIRRVMIDVANARIPGWRGEVEVVGSEGASRWAEVAVSALQDERGVLVLQMAETTARKVAERELEHMAIHDSITGLPNRALLRDRIDLALALVARTGGAVTVLFLDLDDFKRINDSAGHAAGDELLQQVAARLLLSVRQSDTVARIGGDEFVVVLVGAEADAAEASVDRVRLAFDEPFTISSGRHRVTASIGVTTSHPGSTAEDLLRDSDTAMYVSKAEGRAHAIWFDEAFRQRALHAAQVMTEFEGAVGRGEVVLHFQPIVALATERLYAVEALVRWEHPKRGMLSPDQWLDIVSSGPAGRELESWILVEGCRTLADWSRRWGDDCPTLHVNASAGLLAGGDLADTVAHALEAMDAPARRLVIELTESDVESVRGSLRAELERLRASGVRVAVDDFGTGYSAFSRLASLPLDELKIDKSFVAHTLTDERSRVVVKAIVGLAEALGLSTVAEGVESQAQADYLNDLGCDRGQGFLWSRPVPVVDLVSMIDSRIRQM